MTVAVILAGGSGTRVGGELPKQFIKVAGKKIIEHTIDAFEQNGNIDEIAVVCNPAFIVMMEQIAADRKWTKLRKILHGGKERYESSLAAINAYSDDDILMFHDAVRPLVSQRIITDCVSAMAEHDAVDVAVRTTDTVIQVSPGRLIEEIPDRSRFNNGQTPQCFRRSVIARAYEAALKDSGFRTTDDCGVVRRYLPEIPVFVVEGEQSNMKVTYEQDLFLLDKLFQMTRLDISERARNIGTEDMRGTVTVVLGASYGIGRCVADRIRNLGGTVRGFSRSEGGVDVSEPGAVRRALEIVRKEDGRIDYVVNTAGVLSMRPLAAIPDEDIAREIAVNYTGAAIVAKESLRYLRETRGCLLLFTSSSYTRGRMLYSLYSSSKAAVVNLTQALDEEWQADGVRINCICPERTRTPMRTRNFGHEPEGTLCEPERVADYCVAALTSSASGEIVEVRK